MSAVFFLAQSNAGKQQLLQTKSCLSDYLSWRRAERPFVCLLQRCHFLCRVRTKLPELILNQSPSVVHCHFNNWAIRDTHCVFVWLCANVIFVYMMNRGNKIGQTWHVRPKDLGLMFCRLSWSRAVEPECKSRSKSDKLWFRTTAKNPIKEIILGPTP